MGNQTIEGDVIDSGKGREGFEFCSQRSIEERDAYIAKCLKGLETSGVPADQIGRITSVGPMHFRDAQMLTRKKEGIAN